jgi:hypothetical protein
MSDKAVSELVTEICTDINILYKAAGMQDFVVRPIFKADT